MPAALFINGAYEENLAEIENIQLANPGKVCYLQPHSRGRIRLLASAHPTPDQPITLYFSLTKSLHLVTYRAKAIGWQDKRDLTKDPAALALLNQHIKDFQRSEKDIYPVVDGKLCVNLISVIDVQRLPNQIPVSYFIKVADGKPLKVRIRAGGWSPVGEACLELAQEGVRKDADDFLEVAVAKCAG
jgi:5-methylcytosine-specific restriction enzyme A